MICVGKIIGFFGINGCLKVRFYFNDFCYDHVFLEDGKKLQISNIKDNHLVIFKGIDTRTKAEEFLNKTIWMEKDDLKKSESDEHYFYELIGMNVVNEEGKKLGAVIDVNDYGGGVFIEFKGDDKTATVHFNSVLSIESDIIKIENDKVLYN